ncbi:hypothetical protein [Mycolicibacterium porcinum]|uniref:Uncharacterized protein n=1 Tax=Mycolicibacterium porcinum TaxID=39693 RepID=A0AAW5SX70_9MYCO|nr:hypothetical protein [Mycolicibacterium porcinum]MCV7386488.1 hypothetical protein [Mycolicibacterium porcinum]ORB39018.1 hypothetical protein BST41_18555 [Mycolicibacterium porcinum]CDO30842.1 hypothetical protein BN979_03652 [Mycolicibacterium vulneris]
MSEPIVERFYWSTPHDVIAITHDGSVAQPIFPAGIENLADTPLSNQVVVLTKIRDAEGREIGIGSELEWTEGDKLHVAFTITLPARGVLASYQVKDYANPKLVELFSTVHETGEPWEGEAPFVATSGPGPQGRGVIIGGAGEFAGATGTMFQTMNFRRIDAGGAVSHNEETYLLDSPLTSR